MSTEARWASHTDAVRNHWFSRRHQSSDAHRAQSEKRRREREQRLADNLLSNQLWAEYSPETKLKALDERLGIGVGAKRQRAKLV